MTQSKDVNEHELSEDGKYMRRIRSFVRREGRLSNRQARALEQSWLKFGIDYDGQSIDLEKVFGRKAPVVVEIGFGMGASLVTMATEAKNTDYLGIEVHRPGVGACLADVEDAGLTNIRTMEHDAVEVLMNTLPENSIDRLQLFFPDPWHKKRHHKRRIVQPAFIALVHRVLKPGGVFHMATDWENYAEHMLEMMTATPEFQNQHPDTQYAPRPDYRPLTKFEKRGQRLGHGVWDLLFEAKA
ncbi:tRNA (guanosine(46)-N7)-methyltransferase TrmB [Echinimonas agarilytica]|uniref:tRNA (guanine-N(7)-)-methyltransferase n=1 Tax=Echinimonas agarilytica TaxID=1215918 RepID=A0AA41W708_9GAMM|nr:tRNA (guanosine(46)-N7)-methyltransferase TrmB [Echinimonas agarilytica]MCM2680265.1 tRNA (guanosine(46)-N7)-methyltransferase TrmB [Echinimonas agarilytica]